MLCIICFLQFSMADMPSDEIMPIQRYVWYDDYVAVMHTFGFLEW